jgi:hypothetical protein
VNLRLLLLLAVSAVVIVSCQSVERRYTKLQAILACGDSEALVKKAVADHGLSACRPPGRVSEGYWSDYEVVPDLMCSGGKDWVLLWFDTSGALRQYQFGSDESTEEMVTGTVYPPVKCGEE